MCVCACVVSERDDMQYRLHYLFNVNSQSIIEYNHLLSLTGASAEELLVLRGGLVQVHGLLSTIPHTESSSINTAMTVQHALLDLKGTDIEL